MVVIHILMWYILDLNFCEYLLIANKTCRPYSDKFTPKMKGKAFQNCVKHEWSKWIIFLLG